MIGLKISRHFLIQSVAKPKEKLSPALCVSYMYLVRVVIGPFVIGQTGQSNYFLVFFQHSADKGSKGSQPGSTFYISFSNEKIETFSEALVSTI